MPVRSMTGFGQAEAQTPSGLYRVEIRAVNNRFLDIQLRHPKSLNSLEQKIKELITETISRGSVSVFIGCDKENEAGALSWDAETADVEARAPARITEYAKTLTERVRKLLKDPPDEQRLAREIAMMADKLDISEECARLRSHIAAFVKVFDSGEPAGKRMNFLLQEMNREANTMGSKANDTAISHLSVTLKEDIEKIREQIQNIE